MKGLASEQIGKIGRIAAGQPLADYARCSCIERFGDENDRVVLELEPEAMEVIGTPIPAQEALFISRELQDRNMAQKRLRYADGGDEGTFCRISVDE